MLLMGLLVRTNRKSFRHLEVSVYTLSYDNVVRYDSRLVRGITRGIHAVPLLRPDHLPRRQGAAAVAQQKFFGMWKLNRAESKMTHAGDTDQSVAWRSYEPDGDRVRVSWGNDKGKVGSYSAKCNGNPEPARSVNIRCRQVASGVIEGEQMIAMMPTTATTGEPSPRTGKL